MSVATAAIEVATLARFTREQLLQLATVVCEIAKIPVPSPNSSRKEIMDVMLKAAGHTKASPADIAAQAKDALTKTHITVLESTTQFMEHLESEIELMHVVQSELQYQLNLLRHQDHQPKTNKELATEISNSLREMRYLAQHTNLSRMARMIHRLDPSRKLD